MKITGLRIYKFSVPTGDPVRDPATGELLSSVSKPWLLLKVETDSGLAGWGEGTGEWLVEPVEATLRSWQELLIDRDPLQPVALCAGILDRLPWKGGPVFGTAIAAINTALYDLCGRAWEVPIHALLGGRRRHRIRVYGHAHLTNPERAIEEAKELADAGFAGVKGNPLETRTWPMDRDAVSLSLEVTRAVREAVGDSFDILLDAHGSPSPELSIEFARQLEPLRPLFLEEPVKVGDLHALQEVSTKGPVPIATGEKLFQLRDFLPLIQRRACAYLQPDLCHCGGITGILEIARAAEEAQMLMAPHHVAGPVATAATLAVDAVIPNFLIQEMNQSNLARMSEYAEHDWEVRDGHITVGDRPGLGVEIKESDLTNLPYEPLPFRQYRHRDGSWKGW